MKRVLIVEDDQDIVDLLAIHLQDLECSVEKAFDGPAGLQLAMDGG
jgi:DNA-binding response OmpR family regulator